MSNQTIYFRMKKRIRVKNGQQLCLGDICELSSSHNLLNLDTLPIATISTKGGNYHVIDALQICKLLQQQLPKVEIRPIGVAQTLIEVQLESRVPKLFLVVGVWIIIFIGAGLAIINFHTDVSMKEVHQRIYYLLTGNKLEYPLLLQIPYSLGIGLGMILFFNRFLNRRINEEPSPMELEMFLYQETIDQYMIDHEKKQMGKKGHVPHS
ncbi:stage V sporulation protein AA [Seinonella peptonophila]|uniref:Stage V sporulation protein AA n=1 Tax=Seinonella peptonophila TaxID=112248 RepID=A0A1M4TJX6_9BACL|nr:stage V sporulation protein AA [Seinonella peptonophila]SHE44664.1 stage V sporulation protein AA [Seinonella peptonophila]